MFDIGFAELVIIAIVGLLVIGPERLPGAIRTGSAWLGRIKRGFNDIKREVQQELHNDAVMQELKNTEQQLRDETANLEDRVRRTVDEAKHPSEPEDRAGDAAPGNDKSQ
ncbi:twin-arginine translocase subunit TatB [Seongchinamella sediminis]|uniref:Sec-independent protein translocase protein TatB n=1 Tax=Seongchinamella sediminis TaxID=2283635 RepID=A0A3L7E4I6_9GAMM|nr:Sec-independent protein translocase protein TatB [Seongchinamella sediminis]RLQ23503.1 twin-arginine translocase subunit TatB [Seongchinamella sediminis]